MGMSASQVQLLSITARIHNNEYKSQSIENQKLRLATDEDEAYQKYNDALDATKITVAFQDASTGGVRYVDANYQNCCDYNENRVAQYALINNDTGKMIVPCNVKDAYDAYSNDKYSFAWAVLGFDGQYDWGGQEDASDSGDDFYGTFTSQMGPGATGMFVGIGTNTNSQGEGHYDANGDWVSYEETNGSVSLYMTQCEYYAYQQSSDSTLQSKYQALKDSENGSYTMADRKRLLEDFRTYLYKTCGDEIFEQMNLAKGGTLGTDTEELYPDKTWASVKDKFDYYVNLFEAIKDAGGCEVLDEEYQSGDAGATWFNNMVNSGLVTIKILDEQGDKGWTDTSVASSVSDNYLLSEHDDRLDKKAEAEYEYTLNVINRKDTEYDKELKSLNTEREALEKERESLKTVIKDNTERNFGLFS